MILRQGFLELLLRVNWGHHKGVAIKTVGTLRKKFSFSVFTPNFLCMCVPLVKDGLPLDSTGHKALYFLIITPQNQFGYFFLVKKFVEFPKKSAQSAGRKFKLLWGGVPGSVQVPLGS